MLTLSTELTAMPSLDPAVSPLPGPLLSAMATRPPSMVPVPTTERGARMLTLTTDTATDSLVVLLSTPVSPPPTPTGLPRVSTVSSATTTARGALTPIPTTDTDTDVPTVTDMATATDTMVVTTVMDMVMATATATTVKLELSC